MEVFKLHKLYDVNPTMYGMHFSDRPGYRYRALAFTGIRIFIPVPVKYRKLPGFCPALKRLIWFFKIKKMKFFKEIIKHLFSTHTMPWEFSNKLNLNPGQSRSRSKSHPGRSQSRSKLFQSRPGPG